MSITDEELAELKPCPLCGEPASFWNKEEARWGVICDECGCDVSSPDHSREGAARIWNSRPAEAELSQLRAQAAWTGITLRTEQIETGGAHVIVQIERADGESIEVIRSYADIESTIISHWARLPPPPQNPRKEDEG